MINADRIRCSPIFLVLGSGVYEPASKKENYSSENMKRLPYEQFPTEESTAEQTSMTPINGTVPLRYPANRTLEDDTGRWRVIRTHPNCERMVARYLLQRQIGYYLPMLKRRLSVSGRGRIRTATVPVFRGYLCAALDKREHQLLYDCTKILGVVEVPHQEQFVAELGAAARALEAREDLEVCNGLLVGRRALVLSGPLAGIQGTIVKRRRSKTLGLFVEVFNRTILAKIDESTELKLL